MKKAVRHTTDTLMYAPIKNLRAVAQRLHHASSTLPPSPRKYTAVKFGLPTTVPLNSTVLVIVGPGDRK